MNLEPSEMFKALAVETRVKIIELLKSEGPLGAKKIAELVGVTPAADPAFKNPATGRFCPKRTQWLLDPLFN